MLAYTPFFLAGICVFLVAIFANFFRFTEEIYIYIYIFVFGRLPPSAYRGVRRVTTQCKPTASRCLNGRRRRSCTSRTLFVTTTLCTCKMPVCAAVCCSVLQRVACCSALQCVAVCCGVLQCVAVCCSVLRVAVRCSALQCVAVRCSVLRSVALHRSCVHVRCPLFPHPLLAHTPFVDFIWPHKISVCHMRALSLRNVCVCMRMLLVHTS